MGVCLGQPKITNITENTAYLEQKFMGHGKKTLTEDFVCFQQAAIAYLEYFKDNNMDQIWKHGDVNKQGDLELAKLEVKLSKYLNRMDEIVQMKAPGKSLNQNEDAIFKELDKVIACQLNMEVKMKEEGNSSSGMFTGIPLIDIILDIDLFTAHFEDRNKVLRIIKEFFNHCTDMKKLLAKHNKLIIHKLIEKYDKKCHLYINA